jgi:serine/threonine-protein kinase
MTEPDVQWMKERLAPEFEVIRLIGAGDVSQVFLARETGLDRLVAIKVLRRALAADDTAARRFDREARSVARISHPHVASVYRVGKVENLPYLVMEYIEGRTLADLLDGGTRFDEEETVSALTHIAAALSAAHGQRVLHRDVRPANVMRETRTGRFVLTDFGIAGVMESAG